MKRAGGGVRGTAEQPCEKEILTIRHYGEPTEFQMP